MRNRLWTVILVTTLATGACASGQETPTTTAPTTTTDAVSAAVTSTTPPVGSTTTTSTTTTTTIAATTTTTGGSSTTTQPPSQPPEVAITSPQPLTSFKAVYSAADGMFGADVTFVVEVSDPEGDPVTIEWYSSDEGYLGTGETITVRITTGSSDSVQPFITAMATDSTGAVGEDTIQIIVWVPSDT